MSNLTEMRKMREAYMDQIRKDGEKALLNSLKDFFTNFPQVKAITWTQYTPYFMDGNPCEFGVNDIIFYIPKNGEEAYSTEELLSHSHYSIEYPDDYDDEEWEKGVPSTYQSHSTEGLDPALAKAIEELTSDLDSNSDLLQFALGDHARIVAVPGKIHVEEYEHD